MNAQKLITKDHAVPYSGQSSKSLPNSHIAYTDDNNLSRVDTKGKHNWNKMKNVGEFLVTTNSEAKQRQGTKVNGTSGDRPNSSACWLL